MAVKAILLLATLAVGCATPVKRNQVSIGNEYAKDGLLREAAESYRRALQDDPENLTATRNLGLILVKLGDYKGAQRNLEKAIKKYDRDFDANLYLAEAYRAQDKYAEAIFRYKNALTIKPNDVRALKPLSWSYFKIRFYSEALETAMRLQSFEPKDDQTPIILARTLLKLKRDREAIEIIRAAKAKADESSLPYYASVEGDIFYEIGEIAKAKDAYRLALKDQPLLPGALLGLGRCMMDEGKATKAIQFLERAVRIRPKLTEAHFLLGKAYEPIDKGKSLRYYQYFLKQAAADPEFLELMTTVQKSVAALRGAGSRL